MPIIRPFRQDKLWFKIESAETGLLISSVVRFYGPYL